MSERSSLDHKGASGASDDTSSAAEIRRVSLGVLYGLGHTINETWETTELYCPACGERRVWVETGAGDYYEGPAHLCAACASTFTMPTFTMPRLYGASGSEDDQRLEAIRADA